MTVDELFKVLERAKKQGKGHWPINLMLVDDGITYAQSITGAEVAQSYDGEMVWLYPEEGIIQPPPWAQGLSPDLVLFDPKALRTSRSKP
jgi:hypothetical protein